jgi:hypothetical protein
MTQRQLAYLLALCALVSALLTAGAMWGNLSARVTQLETMAHHMWGTLKP